ncbi:hypothetical protein GLOIN_2v1764791 [Rhizophagus irregularis DAOM 181602=DAOM 197198]|nr:hypothetical protein GLOIN_2v1764791 [Rhizophagus irregularis DAOM 181602=DAOM 197198]
MSSISYGTKLTNRFWSWFYEDDEDDDDDDWNEFETDDEDDKDNYWDPSKMYTGWDYLAHFGEDAWNKLSSVGSPSKYCI